MKIPGTWYSDPDVDDLPMFGHECDLQEVGVHWDAARGWHLVAADSERVRVPIRACPGCGLLLTEPPDEAAEAGARINRPRAVRAPRRCRARAD
ncbi:MAG: hypothetical protein AB7G21_04330 [Dehalococcoidia bacterium]